MAGLSVKLNCSEARVLYITPDRVIVLATLYRSNTSGIDCRKQILSPQVSQLRSVEDCKKMFYTFQAKANLETLGTIFEKAVCTFLDFSLKKNYL